MDLGASALAVLRRRYLVRDDQDRIVETPEAMFRRVARAVAAADAAYGAGAPEVAALEERFYLRMAALEFLPNSPTLMNAGRGLGQLAACFVIPVGDSTEEIFESIGWAALIHKTGGGTGFSFSSLRPAGDLIASTRGRASGPTSFMMVFDVATEAVKQGGARRGANMGILRVDHPDILDFVALKLDPARMKNFNLSVGATDAFMEAASRGESYALTHPRTGAEVRRLDAGRVLDMISHAAWATGDPGLVFLDRINAAQPTPELGSIEATNPCGEQPLLPFESCTLGSINLARFVDRERRSVAWERLGEAVRDGVHFLDNVIDVNRYPLPQIDQATRATRKIGLGVMGLADLLIELDVPYDSDRAVALGEEIARFVSERSMDASAALAEVRGAFPAFDRSRWARGELAGAGPRLRNATTTTVAPTGTISIIAGCSSGIEPLYAVAFERNVLEGETLREMHAGFQEIARRRGFWSEELASRVVETGRVRGLAEVPEDVQAVFPTAHEIPVSVHIEMQAAFQRHVHAGVSKTINLTREATPADVAEAFRLAYQLECKGITIYRDGSREAQVLSTGGRGRAKEREAPRCPECEATAVVFGGCLACRECGWSACG